MHVGGDDSQFSLPTWTFQVIQSHAHLGDEKLYIVFGFLWQACQILVPPRFVYALVSCGYRLQALYFQIWWPINDWSRTLVYHHHTLLALGYGILQLCEKVRYAAAFNLWSDSEPHVSRRPSPSRVSNLNMWYEIRIDHLQNILLKGSLAQIHCTKC